MLMTTNLWKPMLAAKPKPEELDAAIAALRYPVLASTKLDGIRASVQNGKLYSRSLKLIPNLEMQARWGREELDGLDGEIVVGSPTAEACFSRSTSIVMSRDKPAEGAVFNVFDRYEPLENFAWRLLQAKHAVDGVWYGHTLRHVHHERVNSAAALAKYEAKVLKAGYEGVMVRDPDGLYKQGRSTLNEGGLVAIKRTVDAEAVILDVYEQEENTNEKALNELGKMKRSSHKAGKVGKGTLGGFTVRQDGVTSKGVGFEAFFKIGTGKGLTEAVRAELWAARKTLPGRLVKFRYQAIGTKDSPRQPIFLGLRDRSDL
jgi:DNA ligase-1